MDLIGELTKSLGVDQTAATALAGAFMGNVAAQAEASDVDVSADKVSEAVPEMNGWLATAQQYVQGDAAPESENEGGMLGSLMGAASSGLGQQLVGAVGGKEAQQAVLLGAVLQKAGLNASHATMAAPFALQFLKSRLDPVWIERLMMAAPLLAGEMPKAAEATGEAGDGGVMGALGGLFGS